MRRERFLLVILLTLVGPGGSDRSAIIAQETVPKELAIALIRAASDGGDILVGKVPADLVEDLQTPPGGRILGSFVSPSYVQVVMAIPGSTDSALAYMRRALPQRGWQPWQRPIDVSGGLQYRAAGGLPTTFCRSGTAQPQSLTIYATFYGYNTSLLRVTRSFGGTCEARVRMESIQSRAGMMPSPFASVPPLYSPSDMSGSLAACQQSSGFRGSSSQGQPVRSALAATEILAHYGRQLDSAGWNSLKEPNTATAAGQWMKADSLGTRLVTITVSAVPARTGCYNVELRLSYD